MIKVRLLVDLPGPPRLGKPTRVAKAGAIHACDEAEAGRLIAARWAEPYVEQAVDKRAIERRTKPKKG